MSNRNLTSFHSNYFLKAKMIVTRIFLRSRISNNIVNNTLKINNYVAPQAARFLYSKAALGLENFKTHRDTIQMNMQNISGKFKEKMYEYCESDTKNMIFSEDLKNMIHLSNEDKDIETVVKMIKKYNQQNRELRFGAYIFGPVVMRLFYWFNKPDVALECFKSPELQGFFDQIISYQVLLDLLYENKLYNEVLEVVDIIIEKQMEGAKYPKNVVVLAFAACYKLNSKESLEYAFKLWKDLKDAGHSPMRRATTFCAALSLNQNEPGIALEILTSAKNANYTTVRNLKVMSLAKSGRVEYAIPILKSILRDDIPQLSTKKHTFNKEVLDVVREAIANLNNVDVTAEFNRLEQIFQKEGHIVNETVDEQLCQEIQKIEPKDNRQQNFVPRNQQFIQDRRQTKFRNYNSRPGLNELH